MSIFEAKEFWSTSVGNSEEFDSNCITIGNIDNEIPQKQKIAVSSFSGILRVYEPSFGLFRQENLLFEKNYDSPILQISLGSFIINSNEKQLAILFSKKLVVVQFFNLRGITSFKTCFEHKLSRNGFNFCTGKIGEKSNDILFIQSVDGTISIFEQDSLVNAFTLNELILPGCIAFLNRKDYFIISNPGYEIECYSYNNIATSFSREDNKKIMYNWIINLGELTKEIKIIDNSHNKKQEILILTETMMHLLSDNGQLLFQKRLDYETMAMNCYNIEDSKYQTNKHINIMQMLSTNSDHLMVYKGTDLSWVLKVHDTPIYLNRIELDGIKGLIISLSDTGRLSILYLGMEPVKNSKIIFNTKNLDTNYLQSETEKLMGIIENFENGIVAIPKNTLYIGVEVSPEIQFDENYSHENIFLTDNSNKIIRCQVKFELDFDGQAAEDIVVTVITPYNIITDENIFSIDTITQNKPYYKIVNFRVISAFYPTNTVIKAHCTYEIKGAKSLSDKGIKTTSIVFELPLSMFIKATNFKNSQHKITINTDKPDPIKISQIFSELTENYIDSETVKASTNKIGFILPNNSETSIAVSNTAGKYRIQATHYEGLLFILSQLSTKLQEYYQNDIKIYIEDDMNYTEFFNVVDHHHKLFMKYKQSHQELESYTSLYTVIQKSLLNKYKEKVPPKLKNLDFLLKHVHRNISDLTDDTESLGNEIKLTFKDLTIWTETMLYLLKLKAKLDDEKYTILKSVFPLDNLENLTEDSWEDMTLANMMNFLKYHYSKDHATMQEIKEVKEIDKWKTCFKSMFEKIVKNNGF